MALLQEHRVERSLVCPLLEGDGVETGVDLDALVLVAEWLAARLGRQLPGQVYRAGASVA